MTDLAGGEETQINVPADPAFSVAETVANVNGKPVPGMTFTFGPNSRVITVRDLGLSDQFEIVEVAGDSTTNAAWMMMAGLAAATLSIDGVPTTPIFGGAADLVKRRIKARLDQIGQDGLAAYIRAVASRSQATSEETVAAAKN